MKSIEFWSRLPVTEKLHLARLVVESADTLSSSDSDTHTTRAELRDLAAMMLENCIENLRDPKQYG